jgi:hypothetical protein
MIGRFGRTGKRSGKQHLEQKVTTTSRSLPEDYEAQAETRLGKEWLKTLRPTLTGETLAWLTSLSGET